MIYESIRSTTATLLNRQLDSFYPLEEGEKSDVACSLAMAWEAVEENFSHCCAKYYQNDDGGLRFDPLHGGQYAVFLYALSAALGRAGATGAATKVYLLNRSLHSVELYYQVELPKVWMLDHPLGSVMGRARFGDFFSFGQGCTVGNVGGAYPEIGQGVTLSAGCSILGQSIVGDCCILGAGAMVKNETIPPFSLVFNRSPNLLIKPRDPAYFVKHYKEYWKNAGQWVDRMVEANK